MERKEAMLKKGYSRILWAVMLVFLCANTCTAKTVASGDTLNLGTGYPDEQILNDWLDVYGTLNMYPGAYVDWGIYAYDDSTVNIYAGEIGAGWWISVSNGANVTVYGKAFALNGTPLDPIPDQLTFEGGSGTLTVTYDDDSTADLLFYSDIPINLVDTAGGPEPEPITIDIKPGSYPNAINLGSNGVIPVAILSTPDLDATTINPDTVFLAGSGVAVRGKGNKYLTSEKDVNGDSLLDLVVKVETENLDPGTFQDGYAILQVIVENIVIYEGADEITIVPPE